jgi:hypothetical protein
MSKMFYGPSGLTHLILETRRRLEFAPELAYRVSITGIRESGFEGLTRLLSLLRNKRIHEFVLVDERGERFDIIVNYHQTQRIM